MIESNNWYGIIGPLIGVIIGSCVTVFVSWAQNKHQRRIEIEKRQIVYLEEIYEQLSLASSQGYIVIVSLARYVSRGSQFDLEVFGKPDTNRLQMLVDFYAPSLNPEVTKLVTHWSKLTIICAQEISGIKGAGTQESKVVVEATETAELVAKAAAAAKQKLISLVKNYTTH